MNSWWWLKSSLNSKHSMGFWAQMPAVIMVHTYSKLLWQFNECRQWESFNHHTFPIKGLRKGTHSIKSSSLKDNHPLQECSSARHHSELLIRWQLILERTSLALSSRRAYGNTSAKRPAKWPVTAIWVTTVTVASQVGFHLKTENPLARRQRLWWPRLPLLVISLVVSLKCFHVRDANLVREKFIRVWAVIGSRAQNGFFQKSTLARDDYPSEN